MTADVWAQLAPPAPSAEQQVKRDRWGRYLLPDPRTGVERSWTRATTIANTLADRYGLEQWSKRNVVLGLGARRDLYTLAASCTPDDKKQLNDIVRQAEDAAAGKAGANQGTALHRLTERADAGELLTIPDPALAADVAAYQQAMVAAGVRVARSADDGRPWIERILLVPELEAAGTCDRICIAAGRAAPLVGDLKTGRDVLRYGMTEIALQLAIYAHATHWFDTAAGQLHPMPPVDQERAIVMHLPVGRARCQLINVDIAAGWEAVQLAVAVRRWRKRDDLAHIISVPAPVAAPPLRAVDGAGPAAGAGAGPDSRTTSPAAAPPNGSAPAVDYADPGQLATTSSWVAGQARAILERTHGNGHSHDPADDARVAWLRQRVGLLLGAGHEPLLRACWPPNTPTLRDGGLTNSHVDTVAAVCAAAEAFYELPFGASDPAVPPVDDGSGAAPAPAPPAADPGAEARQIAEQAKALLDGYDDIERRAIAECALVGNDPMTAERYDRLEAVATQVADPNGAVVLLYGPDEAGVFPAPGAADRMAAAANADEQAYGKGFGTGKGAALTRAKRLAKALGLPAPRSLAQAAENATLAALVAAGRGSTPEGNTTSNDGKA